MQNFSTERLFIERLSLKLRQFTPHFLLLVNSIPIGNSLQALEALQATLLLSLHFASSFTGMRRAVSDRFRPFQTFKAFHSLLHLLEDCTFGQLIPLPFHVPASRLPESPQLFKRPVLSITLLFNTLVQDSHSRPLSAFSFKRLPFRTSTRTSTQNSHLKLPLRTSTENSAQRKRRR